MLKLLKKKEQKPKSIFMGRKVRKYWELYDKEYILCVGLEEKTETLERIKLLEKEMDFEFNVDEEIFLEELGKYTRIEKKTRDTNGNTIYNITYVCEVVEDYDENLKLQYETLIKKYKLMQEEKNKECEEQKKKDKLKEQQDEQEYIKFCKEKELIIKKGIIINKLPLSENGLLINSRKCEEIHKAINKKFMNYDIVSIPTNLEIFNYDENGKIVGLKDENIIFKN